MNLFCLPDPLPAADAPEVLAELLARPGVHIERIVSTGQQSDWYNQTEHEWVALLQGQATIAYPDGRETQLHAGDTLFLPAGVAHRVAATSAQPPCIWLCVFWPGEPAAKIDSL